MMFTGRLVYNLVILPWRNITMMFAPLHLFALGREEECALLGALMLVINVSCSPHFTYAP